VPSSLYLVLLAYMTVDDHCGYAFPWSPVRWFPLSANTDQHEFHHSKNMGCFASKLAIYDQLFDRYYCCTCPFLFAVLSVEK
jgi:sterol desaturase/sphingolipid hydroxylase (fatty acid hydroxylase superfamily)